jgi:hypothetical protein
MATPFFNMKNVEVLAGDSVPVDVISLHVKRNNEWIDRPSGRSKLGQRVHNMENPPDIELEFNQTSDFHAGMIVPNTLVGTFSVDPEDPDTATLLQSDFFTKWPLSGMVWGDPDTTLEGDSTSTIKVPILAGVLNPTPTVVVP